MGKLGTRRIGLPSCAHMDTHMLDIAADVAGKYVDIKSPKFGSQRGLRSRHSQNMAEDGPEDGCLQFAPQFLALHRLCIYNEGVPF